MAALDQIDRLAHGDDAAGHIHAYVLILIAGICDGEGIVADAGFNCTRRRHARAGVGAAEPDHIVLCKL
ncbi:hypothetical protein SDC9_190484 [bioreactor metagenome]|uniref:Uncharacterized protein n=1 Tax=bioreactor metagenome TaxID=1076179 RepID=A0A645HWG5_9ZZZZ